MKSINRMFRKTLFEDHFTDDEEIAKFIDPKEKKAEKKILKRMSKVNREINKLIIELREELPVEMIVNNLIKQAIEISYWNFKNTNKIKDLLKEIFEFHLRKTFI